MFSFVKYHPVEYGSEQYPLWADLIGWMMPLSTNLPIIVVAVIVVYNSHGNTILEVRQPTDAFYTTTRSDRRRDDRPMYTLQAIVAATNPCLIEQPTGDGRDDDRL